MFLTLCFELCFYTNSFCPLPFLESDVVFFLYYYFVISRHERKVFSQQQISTQRLTHSITSTHRSRGNYTCSQAVQNHFILKIAIVKREPSMKGMNEGTAKKIIEKRIPQQGFQFSIIVLNIMHDTLMLEGRNPVGMLALNAIQRESLHGSFFVNFVI